MQLNHYAMLMARRISHNIELENKTKWIWIIRLLEALIISEQKQSPSKFEPGSLILQSMLITVMRVMSVMSA